MLDPVEFGKAMAAIVREHTDPLLRRIEELEARQLIPGKDGEPGKDGASVSIADVAPLIEESVRKAVEAIPKPKDGDPGKDGVDAEPIAIDDVVRELISSEECRTLAKLSAAEAVVEYLREHPVKDGAPGKDGRDGDSVTDEQVERAVASHLRANPPQKGDDGADGIGMAGAMIDREGCLILTTTKGATVNLGRVVGKDGDPGKDGADFSDASIDFDGERTFTIRGRGGDIVKRSPIPLDKGYWREGMECEKSDIVTHNGNAWLALRDTKAKPCLENRDDWRLFARKGRDGRDGTNGRDAGPPPPVKLNGA